MQAGTLQTFLHVIEENPTLLAGADTTIGVAVGDEPGGIPYNPQLSLEIWRTKDGPEGDDANGA